MFYFCAMYNVFPSARAGLGLLKIRGIGLCTLTILTKSGTGKTLILTLVVFKLGIVSN